MPDPSRIIVGISGASGALYALRLLEALQKLPIETHLVVSKAGRRTIDEELDVPFAHVRTLADFYYPVDDIGARIASGSFLTDGMIIAPCSIRTAAEIATGMTASLLTRAADVTLKERRPLILSVRETPLHLGHLRTLAHLAEIGAIVAPPLPALYTKPASIEDVVNNGVGRLLDLLHVPNDLVRRWGGRARDLGSVRQAPCNEHSKEAAPAE